MTSIRVPMGRVVLFALLTLLMLLASFPLHVALELLGFGGRGLSARSVSGAVLNGEMADARFGDVALGSPHTRLTLWRLLIGEAQLVLSGTDTAALTGRLIGFRSGFALDDVNAALPVAAMGVPFAGTLTLNGFEARFEDGRCTAASGQASTDVLSLAAGQYGLPAVALTGTPRCEGDVLVLPLSGSGAGAQAALDIRLSAAGTASGSLSLSGLDASLGDALVVSGFRSEGGNYRLNF